MIEKVYKKSYGDAIKANEEELWRKSLWQNIECREKIDALISESFDGYKLKKDIIELAVEEFGDDRVSWVLANTVQQFEHDGRYRPETKQWAKDISIPNFDGNYKFALKSHPEIVNGVINNFRNYQNEKQHVWGKDSCKHNSENENYEGQLLIIKPEILKKEYRKDEFQLFYATSGFGCKPDTLGNKVFGFSLLDGEDASFRRSDFLGIADEEKLPDWAQRKLEELQTDISDVMSLLN